VLTARTKKKIFINNKNLLHSTKLEFVEINFAAVMANCIPILSTVFRIRIRIRLYPHSTS
jgi:hypothetical protein